MPNKYLNVEKSFIGKKFIYIKNRKTASFSTLEELIREIAFNRPETTYVEDDTFQCSRDKNRSVSDIFLIAKHYLPNTTIKQLLACIYKQAEIEGIYPLIYCPHISKYVISPTQYTGGFWFNAPEYSSRHKKDEMGFEPNDYRIAYKEIYDADYVYKEKVSLDR